MADGFKIIENHMSSHGISIEPLEDYFSCLIEYTEDDRFDKNLFVRREAEKIVRGGSQHSTKTLERAFELSKKTYLYAARDDFHSYCVYLEWNREPHKRFYQPRMRVLRPIVQDMQDLIDDKLDLLAISLPPGSGKALAFETPVLTRSGWKQHGDLTIRDEVIAPNGNFVKVLAIHPVCEMEYEVVFSNGEKIICHGKHEWRVFNRHRQKYEILETRAMIDGIENDMKGRGHRYHYMLPHCAPIKGEKKTLPIDPYTLGVWLGDGTNRNPTICNAKTDKIIIDTILENGYTMAWDVVHKGTGVHYYGFKELRQQLQSVGMCHSRRKTPKHIPCEYLTASIDQRLELLAGLIDTDGFVRHAERKCNFTTADEELRDDFISLVSTFGWRCNVTRTEPRVSSSGINGVRPYWCIGFSPTIYIPCKLPQKQLYNFSDQRRVSITEINKHDGCYGNCITVDGGEYLVGRRLVPTHNSTLQIFLHSWVMGRDPDKPNLASGHSGMLTGSIYDGVCSILNDRTEYLWSDVFPETRNIITNAKETTIDLNKKHRFSTLTCRAIGASLTGATRCEGLLTADDLVSGIEEALSKERLDKLWEAYGNDLKSRKKLGAKELHLATRWSIHDVIGRLDRMYGSDERAKFVVIPALNANGESNFDYDYGVGFNTAFFEDMRNNIDDASFRALYMNEPIEREGQLYSPSEMRRFFELPQEEPDAIISICDTKDTGKDYQFLPVAYQYGKDYYIADCICNNGAPEVLDELSAEILVKHKVKLCRFESNSAGGRAADKVQEKVKSKGGITHITKKFTTANKETKILVNSPFVKEHMLFLDDSVVTRGSDYWRMLNFMFGYTQMGKNKNDDVPDGLAQLAEFIQSLNVTRIEIAKRPF